MAKTFAESTNWFKAAIVFDLVAFALHIAGIYLPHFMDATISKWEACNNGLWQTCCKRWTSFDMSVQCEESMFTHLDWLLVVQILQCIGLAAIVVTILTSLLLLLAVTNEKLASVNRLICFASLWLVGPGTIATLMMLLRTPVTESFDEMNIGLSFYLCIGAIISLLITYILLLVDARKSNT